MKKVGEDILEGTVKIFKKSAGYGFILMDDGTDIFVHFNDIISEDKYKVLYKGDKVTFEIIDTERGQRAVNVVITEKALLEDIPKKPEWYKRRSF